MKERTIKKILVTTNFRGKVGWQLVTARKVGKQYQITDEAYQEIIKRSGAGYGQTLIFG